MREIIYIFILTLLSVTAQNQDACTKCIRKDLCEFLTFLTPLQQDIWAIAFSCQNVPQKSFYAIYNRGNYVCCDAETLNEFITTFVSSDDIKLETKNIPDKPIGPTTTPRGMVYADAKTECPASSLPPRPDSSCCGLEASQTDRINARNSRGERFVRNADDLNKIDVSIGTRIAGGEETDFFDYPWTVYLSLTFKNEDDETQYQCGGSLISSRFVLTAAHCVVHENTTLVRVEAHLAEYDTNTFPEDCKIVRGREQCITNMIIQVERVIIHKGFTDDLKNDIALLKLETDAPYTAYIRPICLPTMDIDDPSFEDLPLPTAGWGNNGPNKVSHTKKSTVVNLVPKKICEDYYNLLSTQMCAAGYSGEDTCQGDSGGPLMTVKGQKHYVVGIVSGKRADAPCGTSVPTLYTNVYEYLDWINGIIELELIG